MASLQWRKGKNGDRVAMIQVKHADGTRKTIGLGAISERNAAEVKARIEDALDARRLNRQIDRLTAGWLDGVGDDFRRQLEHAGVVDPTEKHAATLGAFLSGYVNGRRDVKASTLTVLGHTKRCLVEYFGTARELDSITPGDMDDWRQWLIGDQGLAENTVRRRCGIARQYFRAAMRKRLIQSNPAEHLTVAVKGNVKRRYIVTPEEAAKVMAACPDAEWRTLFALARWGGLRIPSEAFALRWGDVDWERGRLHVTSPKTEHHEHGAERFIPLFPELRAALEALYHAASEGTEWIINRYRDPTQNIRTQLAKIIRRAGLVPWPKLWVNLRATRATELAALYPVHVSSAWMGHSVKVAAGHYLTVRDEDFDRATRAAQALHSAPVSGSLGQSEDEGKPYSDGPRGVRNGTDNETALTNVGPPGLEPGTRRL